MVVSCFNCMVPKLNVVDNYRTRTFVSALVCSVLYIIVDDFQDLWSLTVSGLITVASWFMRPSVSASPLGLMSSKTDQLHDDLQDLRSRPALWALYLQKLINVAWCFTKPTNVSYKTCKYSWMNSRFLTVPPYKSPGPAQGYWAFWARNCPEGANLQDNVCPGDL